MKRNLLLLFICFITKFGFTQVNPTLVNIPHQVFVNNGSIDFTEILSQDANIKDSVKTLHAYNEINHDFTIVTNTFEEYWNQYRDQWHWITFNDDSSPLLLFQGIMKSTDEREFVEIYDLSKKRNEKLLFTQVGDLLAFKRHPRTKEVILYVHKYPCCRSASHNIYRIRKLENDLKVNDRFFVGRDAGDMVGPFFPEEVKFSADYQTLNEKTGLRWSPEIIEENAFLNWTESNLIIHYNKGAKYKVLHEDGNWQFVVFFSGIAEEQSMMLNYTNFKNKGVYGWIKVKNTN